MPISDPASPPKRIALTFDDVPRAGGAFLPPDDRAQRLIAALAEAGVEQAGFFVTPGNFAQPQGIGAGPRIAAYVDAGHVIANHSHSGRALGRMTADAYLADIDQAERWLAGRRGHRPWYRFTYLDEGADDPAVRDAVRAGLARRGLANAYITVNFHDWLIDDLAGAAHNADQLLDVPALKQLYAGLMLQAAEFADRLALETIGRSPVHVLLLHETDMTAILLAEALATLKSHGWEMATVDEAYRDPIADIEPDAPYLAGGRIAAIASAAGRPQAELTPDVTNANVVTGLFNAHVLHQAQTA